MAASPTTVVPTPLGTPEPVELPACPADREARTHALLQAFDERVLVMDGATGTAMQRLDLTAEDFGGPDLEGCNEALNLTRPDAVLALHDTYLRAGADVVETNTFGATPLVLAEYDLAGHAFGINRAAAALARQACAGYDEPGRLRFVCGSMGPTTKATVSYTHLTLPTILRV